VPSTGRSLAGRILELLRTWWPVAAFLVPVLVVQTGWSARYDVAGHAADHLQSATPVFPMVFLSAVLLWALPGHGRRDLLLWLLLAAAIASCLVVLAGNVQVIDAIGGATWSDTQASQLGPARPGFESGHDLAALGAWGAVLSTMLAAGLLWRRRRSASWFPTSSLRALAWSSWRSRQQWRAHDVIPDSRRAAHPVSADGAAVAPATGSEPGTSSLSGTFAGCVLAARARGAQLIRVVELTVVVRSIP
jgi:hypothetical protein